MGLDNYTTNITQMAAKLGYHPQTLRVLAKAKKIPALKRGHIWLFDENEVFKHLQAETEKNAGGDTGVDRLIR